MKLIYNNIIPFKGFKAINLFGLCFVRKGNAYRNISFEKEAYTNENDLTYLTRRKHYGMWK